MKFDTEYHLQNHTSYHLITQPPIRDHRITQPNIDNTRHDQSLGKIGYRWKNKFKEITIRFFKQIFKSRDGFKTDTIIV